MKKALRETQTLCVGCSKDPFPGVRGGAKFNHLEMVTTYTYKPSLVRIDARNFKLWW